MSDYHNRERRGSPRTSLVTFCPVTFERAGAKHSALMVNLSESGAGFRIGGISTEFFSVLDREITYSIETPYGTTYCRARTVWAKRNGEGYEWGAEFTERSDNEDDPLRILLESPF